MNSSVVWNGHQDPTLSVPQDDFQLQQFLDMGTNLDFDFPDFNAQPGQVGRLMQQDNGDMMDTGLHNLQMPSMSAPIHPALQIGSIPPPANDALSNLDAQIQYLQHQRHETQQRQIQEQQRNYYSQGRMVPPTPNSIEMHGNNGQFYHQAQAEAQQHAMFDQYRMQVKEHQDLAFTPLVSPAVTPLDAHFSIPEYTVPGAYFSPLSSPALHAQNEHSSAYDRRLSGTTNSPIDMSLDNHSAHGSTVILPKRQVKKTALKTQRPATRSVRQSPIVKPKRGKKMSTSTLPPNLLGEILEPSHPQLGQSHGTDLSRSAVSTEESENGSISPEHLSDMAPPPLPNPSSATRSPAILGQTAMKRAQAKVLGSPATPASLMRLAQSEGAYNGLDMDIDDTGLDGFLLPEAANGTSKPLLARLDTMSDGQLTPTLSSTSARTPGFQPLPSAELPESPLTASVNQSPRITTLKGSSSGRKSSVASRSNKKRPGSSILASPALLPRISPSIKPLLPGGISVSEDTASLLLASKSNYQNILEGTHLPGVSYPMELSTNLTSKRTSHKIAEQGRRNRINTALQEIATLLPKGPPKDSGGEKSGSGDGGEGNEQSGNGATPSQSANSKASTVEQAIEYIKSLQKAVDEANRRAEEAESKLKEKP